MTTNQWCNMWCGAWLDQVQSILNIKLPANIIDNLSKNCKICLNYLCLTKSSFVIHTCWVQCGYVNNKTNLDQAAIWPIHCINLYKILLMLYPSTVNGTWQEMKYYPSYIVALKELCKEITILHLKKIFPISELDIQHLINILNTVSISCIDTLLELCKFHNAQDIQKILMLRTNSHVLSDIINYGCPI